ncbi:MAG: hypothetical protein QM650_13495 [Microlunatus sp.]
MAWPAIVLISTEAGSTTRRRVMRVGASERPSKYRTWLVACAAAVVLIAVAVLTISRLLPSSGVSAPRPTNGQVVTIEQGLAYDASNLHAVMDNTDTAFVATVLAVTDRDEDDFSTTFRVELKETIDGVPSSQPLVRQRGYVDRQGTLHIIEGQSLLEVGRTYVFATVAEPSLDLYEIAPGPHAARPLELSEIPTIMNEYRAAR